MLSFKAKPEMCEDRQRALAAGTFIYDADHHLFFDMTMPKRHQRKGGTIVYTGRYTFPVDECCCPWCGKTLRLLACRD